MRIILFGAGASFGSGAAIPYPPPLGEGLFDELCNHYPEAWGRIPTTDRHKFVPNFELGMEDVWKSGTNNVPVLMRCLADYFARFRARPNSIYSRLLDCISARGILKGMRFSTLNYECLFETAARNFGFREIEYLAQEPTDETCISIWKLHGSCNFLPASVSGGAANVDYTASSVSWNGELRIVDPFQVGPFVASNAFYPAMAVFMEGKPVHSHPSVIYQIQGWWRDTIGQAATVGIIGVRPNEKDTHIWDALANAQGRVIVIGDKAKYQVWAQANRGGKETRIVGEKFESSLTAFVDAMKE